MINLVLAFRGLGDTVMTYQIFERKKDVIYLVRNPGAQEFLSSQQCTYIKVSNYLTLLLIIFKYSFKQKKNFYNAQGDKKFILSLLKLLGFSVFQSNETQEDLALGKQHKINHYSKTLEVGLVDVALPDTKSLSSLLEVLFQSKRVHVLLDSAGKEKIPKSLLKIIKQHNYNYLDYGGGSKDERSFRIPRDLGKIDQECDVIVCSDSGISHWLGFLGYHVCVVFGPTNPYWTGAVGNNVVWFINDQLDCVPCQGSKYLLNCNKAINCINDDKYFNSN